MTKRERIPHTARFLMTFHTAGNGFYRTSDVSGSPDSWASAGSVSAAYEPSASQRALIEKLIGEIRELNAETAASAVAYTAKMDAAQAWTAGRSGNVSRWIDHLISKVKTLRAENRAAMSHAAMPAEIEDGMYFLDGEIYKVVHAVHGSGRQYAKRLVAPAAQGERASWERAPGVVRMLRPMHRMTLEQAKEYGRLYGVCCECGAVLTDEDSIAAGIGPICAGRF